MSDQDGPFAYLAAFALFGGAAALMSFPWWGPVVAFALGGLIFGS